MLQLNLPQRLLMRSIQKDLWDDFIAILLPASRLKGLQPSRRTETPLTPALHTRDDAQVVALARGEVEEFLCDFGCDGVRAHVGCGDFAVACAEEAGHGRGAVEGERFFEDWMESGGRILSLGCFVSLLHVSCVKGWGIVPTVECFGHVFD